MSEDDFFSSESTQPQEEGIPSPEGYETLEQYIRETKRDHDKEDPIPIRTFDWQETLMTMIEIDENTNKQEIGARAYPMGLSILRGDHKDDVDEIAKMMATFMGVYSQDVANVEVADETDKRISNREVDQPYEEDQTVGDPTRFKVEKGYKSEAVRDYADHSFMQGWIHRHIISLGLSKSENAGAIHRKKISSYSAAFSEAIDEFRESVEEDIKRYVLLSREGWRDSGMVSEVHEGLCEIQEIMETRSSEIVEAELEDLERFVEDQKQEQEAN